MTEDRSPPGLSDPPKPTIGSKEDAMSERHYRGTVVFDIIGTCFSLNRVAEALTRAGAPSYSLALWFARSLRDAFALSHAGGYQPLKWVLEAQWPRTLQQLQVTA